MIEAPIRLHSGDGRAVVATEGAELRAWSVAGRDLLWPGDAASWPRSAPVLFPVVGWVRDGKVLVDGVWRPMGVHGFAADMQFTVVDRTDDRVTLALRDDRRTRSAYPFAFELEVTYRVAGQLLEATLVVRNPGDRRLPYAVGLHPGFRWPLSGEPSEGHAIIFAADERPEVPVIAPGGLFAPARRPVPLDGRRLRLSADLMAAEALCFLDVRSRSLRFEDGAGAAIAVAWEGFPHLALWSLPGAPFLCIESWTGHGDPVGFAGELADKPSMLLLPPGE
ncbi:MAG: aldose 1-epimerase family protein, partial [Alphaproteobacteria bacterium]